MKIKALFLLLFSLLSTTFSWGNDDLKYMKTTVDAMAFKDALYVLTRSGVNPKIEVYENKIKALLDELGTLNTGFRKDTFPIELRIDDENRPKIIEICNELTKTMGEIRELMIYVESQFVVEKQDLLLIFKSENPGDYYTGINPGFQYKLYNHPLRNELEQIQLQDIGFVEFMVSGDSSLWDMGAHCPNLKTIIMFAAEIGVEELERMKLNKLKALESLELSENYLTELPTDFNSNNSLRFLSLSKNGLVKLPNNIGEWTNLKYLNLANNQLNDEEKERIQKALPNAVIKF